MFRTFALLSLPVLVLSVGCGKSEPVANNSATTSGQAATANASQPMPPTEVVSQFLDLVRRGGEDSGANELLTTKAKSELARINRSIQPIGSPDASFKVTRAAAVEDEENAQVVHSVWTEPGENGATEDYEVVWALQLEDGAWRISGLAMELTPGNPTIINFEDGAMMAQLLGVESAAPAQAEAPGATDLR